MSSNNLFKNTHPSTSWTPLFIGVSVVGVSCILVWVAWSHVKEYLRTQLLPHAAPTHESPASPRGQWCFVGEDLTGRWCVKTPEDGLCPTKRIFQRRSECEMKTASASPLGINQNHDTTMIPIAGLSIA
jgi:hypothetical protein